MQFDYTAEKEDSKVMVSNNTDGKTVIKTGETPGPTYLSSKEGYNSALRRKYKILKEIDELGALIEGNGDNIASGQGTILNEIPDQWPEEKSACNISDLYEADEKKIFNALKLFITGNGDKVKSYENVVKKRYFPMRLITYAASTIVISPGHPLIIEPSGHDPVLLEFDLIEIEPGGQIICGAPVIIKVKQFIKK